MLAALAVLAPSAALAQIAGTVDATTKSRRAQPAHFHHVHLNVTDPATIDRA